MSDLYDQAAAFPRTLRGTLTPADRDTLLRRGLSDHMISWRAARTGLVRVTRDGYLLGRQVPDLLDRIRAAMLVLPPGAVFGFHTAAALHGFGVLRTGALHIVVPAGTPVPQRRGVTTHESVLPCEEIAHPLGIPCTPPARTAIDLARRVRRRDALPVLDAALRTGALRRDDLLVEVARHDRLRGVRQARELVLMADPRAECRQETQLRLVLRDAGLLGFEPQVEVCDEDGWLAFRIDLGDRKTMTGVEYDGASHLDRARASADRSRHNWLAARGWTLRYFTGADLYRHPRQLVRVVAEAQARRSRRSVRD